MDDRVSQLSQPIILLSRQDLAALMPFGAYVDAVGDAFRLHAQCRTLLPNPMHVVTDAGGFHVKAGGLPSGCTTESSTPPHRSMTVREAMLSWSQVTSTRPTPAARATIRLCRRISVA